jgi:hypothetical protein
MWQEARKQEKKIRGLMVDYKKRAERRREFYEKIVGRIQKNPHDGFLNIKKYLISICMYIKISLSQK